MAIGVTRPPWTTWVVSALLTAAAAFAGIFLSLSPDRAVSPDVASVVMVIAAVPGTCAVLLAHHRPGHPASALLAATAVALVVTNLPDGERLGPFQGIWMLLYLPLAILLLTVPTGQPASARWRAVGWSLVGLVAVFTTVVAAHWAAGRAASPAWSVLLPVFLLLLVASASAPLVRYRTAPDDQRVQLRWVLVAGMSLPSTLLLCWASYLVLDGPDLVGIGLATMYLAIPLGVTIALIRPRAVDVDRVAVAIATVIALGIADLGALSIATAAVGRSLTEWSPVATTVVTAVVILAAVAAFPLVHKAFDRLLYPTRARTLAALRRLTVDIDDGKARPEDVLDVLREAMRDTRLEVAIRQVGTTAASLTTLEGMPVTVGPAECTTPIRAHGEHIGFLISSTGTRPAGAIVRAAAPLIESVRSRAQVTLAMAEVEASRERLLRAGYEERRRLERDLHDGAQQRLVALGMRLRVLQRGATVSDGVADELDTAVAELGTAVAELRRLGHGMRPSALDDGLLPALADLVRQAPSVIELDVPALDLPDAVATTAYFVVSEAVTNALRHADATRIRVAVRSADHVVRVRVSDDGSGGAALRPRGGLTGLSDRVGALGGLLTVTSPAGAGTSVEAVLPCAS